jgi:hypothetical protein
LSDISNKEITNTERLEKLEKQIDDLRWATGILVIVVSLLSSYIILQSSYSILIVPLVVIILCILLLRASCFGSEK